MKESLYKKIKKLADTYKDNLDSQIDDRTNEMNSDQNNHYMVYNVLGINDDRGFDIDLYQNVGRFLYKYAGSFMEEAAILCIQDKFPLAKKIHIDNPAGSNPKTFEIDCLVNGLAHEIKWRDATTDGDHVHKEERRVNAIKRAGYKPVRVMFFKPQRAQAQRIQARLKQLYRDINGEYYEGEDAFSYIERLTGNDLYEILERIAQENNEY